MEQTTIAQLAQLAPLARDYAPFFFAVVYAIAIPPMAYRWYATANARPQPNDLEQRTTRHWFLVTTYFGFFLVLASIGWYFFVNRPLAFVYEGFVLNLERNESVKPVVGTEYFSRPEFIGDNADQRNEHFLVKNGHPFYPGQKIHLKYQQQPEGGGTEATGNAYRPKPPPRDVWIEVLEPTNEAHNYEVRALGETRVTSGAAGR